MSSTPLPVLRGPSTALYPFTQTFICNTGRSDGQAAYPTRWVKSPPIVKLEFPYPQMTQSQKNAFLAFMTSAAGEFATNLSAALTAFSTPEASIPAITFTNLSFDTDEFSATESRSTLYDAKWQLTQTITQNFSPGSSGGAYPTNYYGAISELPYTQKSRSQTIVSMVTSGPKYTYQEFGAGLANFPTAPLLAWDLDEHVLTDLEVLDKVAHFLSNWGSCFPFTFKDENGTTYSNVYYASDQLVINRKEWNNASMKTSLIQMG